MLNVTALERIRESVHSYREKRKQKEIM